VLFQRKQIGLQHQSPPTFPVVWLGFHSLRRGRGPIPPCTGGTGFSAQRIALGAGQNLTDVGKSTDFGATPCRARNSDLGIFFISAVNAALRTGGHGGSTSLALFPRGAGIGHHNPAPWVSRLSCQFRGFDVFAFPFGVKGAGEAKAFRVPEQGACTTKDSISGLLFTALSFSVFGKKTRLIVW